MFLQQNRSACLSPVPWATLGSISWSGARANRTLSVAPTALCCCWTSTSCKQVTVAPKTSQLDWHPQRPFMHRGPTGVEAGGRHWLSFSVASKQWCRLQQQWLTSVSGEQPAAWQRLGLQGIPRHPFSHTRLHGARSQWGELYLVETVSVGLCLLHYLAIFSEPSSRLF